MTASRRNCRSGFTFIELIIVVTIIGLLAILAIPSYEKARTNTRLSLIYRNLRTIDQAKDQWALEQKKTTGATVSSMTELSPYFRDGKVHDVINEAYVVNPVGTPPVAALPGGVALGPYGPGASIPAP